MQRAVLFLYIIYWHFENKTRSHDIYKNKKNCTLVNTLKTDVQSCTLQIANGCLEKIKTKINGNSESYAVISDINMMVLSKLAFGFNAALIKFWEIFFPEEIDCFICKIHIEGNWN